MGLPAQYGAPTNDMSCSLLLPPPPPSPVLVIPLTKKLKECGVFGVSSGEYIYPRQLHVLPCVLLWLFGLTHVKTLTGCFTGEYLNYALKNREEWELRGQDVVAGMIEEMKKKYGDVVKPE